MSYTDVLKVYINFQRKKKVITKILYIYNVLIFNLSIFRCCHWSSDRIDCFDNNIYSTRMLLS